MAGDQLSVVHLVALPSIASSRYVWAMNLELTDEQSEALIRLLSRTIDDDRYPLSPRIVLLKEILAQLRPEPERAAPLPPLRNYEPPSMGRYKRRR
jgi:hypothetical protein